MARYNFKQHIKGDTFSRVQFTFSKDNAAMNLTGAAIKIDFKRNKDDSAASLTLEVGSGITLDDAANGIWSIDEQVIDIPAGQYHYDVQLTEQDGSVHTYLSGNINILQDVTT